MEKAYIILAHRNPAQLLKLIIKLDDGKSTFFLHVDKKVDIHHFKQVTDYSSKIHLVKREYAHWGNFSLVRATLNALEMVRDYKHFDRITLLSGQDYPIKNNDAIDLFYKTSKHSVFVEYTTIPDFKRWPSSGGLYRVNKYFFGLKGHQLLASKTMNLGSTIIPALRRRSLNNITPFAGAQWWTIDNYALNYILDFVNNNPWYTDFHKYTFAPDEVYFQSILLNSKDERIIRSIANDNLMYSKWHSDISAHPELLNKKDVPDMLSSDSLFARKFEQENNTEVFDLINRSIDKKDISHKVKV